jgi:2-oxoglutarate ferredoxin oxidoreductase subunit alpha
MAKRMPEVGGVCMFPGTEVEGITMVQGAAGAGVRAMTATSSTAYSLMQETVAECANGGWPAVIVNMGRGSLQGDYYQTVKGGGHGDYQLLVLAPHSCQEMVDLTYEAFDLAQKYHHPVVIFADSVLAHTTETVSFKTREFEEVPEYPWPTDGEPGRERHALTYLGKSGLSTDIGASIAAGLERFKRITENEIRYEEGYTSDAEFVVITFGTAARYAKFAIEELRKEGEKIGFLRPITLNPFPIEAIARVAEGRRGVICFELNRGAMIHDIRSAIFGRAPVYDIKNVSGAQTFGAIPSVAMLKEAFRQQMHETASVAS